MPNTQEYREDYTEFGDNYQLVLPLNIEGLIPEDESVRLLSHELEDLDYHKLYAAYSAKGRNPAVDPKTMFKLLVYAYSQQIYSSRGNCKKSFSQQRRRRIYAGNKSNAADMSGLRC